MIMAAPRPVSLTAAATAPDNHEPEPLVVVGGVPSEGLPVASLTVAGIVELATTDETTTGTSTTLAVTPAGVKAVADTKLTIPTPGEFIADPTAGNTVDAEARAAIASILDLLIAQGLMASEPSGDSE
jgi:hypothetical protein